jgi:signal transduction histidine kinase
MKNITSTKILAIEGENESLLIHHFINKNKSTSIEILFAQNLDLARIEIIKNKYEIVLISEEYFKNHNQNKINEFISTLENLPFIIIGKNHETDLEYISIDIGASDYLTSAETNSFQFHKSVQRQIYQSKVNSKNKENEIQIMIQDRLSSMKILSSSLAHEIGTPLGVIRGRAEFLSLKKDNESFLNKNLSIIIVQADRISHLINSLLNLANGTQEKSSTPNFIQNIIKDVTELLEPEFKKFNIIIKNEINDEDKIELNSNIHQLHQVMLNILINSVQAIESSVLQGRTNNHYIQITCKTEQNFNHFVIRDTGCGITEKNIRNIFNPFFTTKEIGKGIGLGLTISHRIIESWGGKIQISSKLNEGSTISIFLPIK